MKIKLLITFVFISYVLSAQSDTSQYSISWKELNSNSLYSLEFESPEGKVTFLKNVIITEQDTIFCSGDILPVINECINKIMEQNIKKINDLQDKILFYETYFGTLSKRENCFIFIPVENKPAFKHCGND